MDKTYFEHLLSRYFAASDANGNTSAMVHVCVLIILGMSSGMDYFNHSHQKGRHFENAA